MGRRPSPTVDRDGPRRLPQARSRYKEEADLLEIVEKRLEPTRTVLKALMSRPSKLAQAAVNFGDAMKHGGSSRDDYDPDR